MNVFSATYKTIVNDNYKTYRANPGRTLLAAAAIAATGFYLPVLVMPMLYTALASFVANVFYNMGKDSLPSKASRSALGGPPLTATDVYGEDEMRVIALTVENQSLRKPLVELLNTTTAVDAATQPLIEEAEKLRMQIEEQYLEIERLTLEIERLTRLVPTAVGGHVDTKAGTNLPSGGGMFGQPAPPLTIVTNNHAVDGTVNTSGRSTPV